jgi:hypothetical protein
MMIRILAFVAIFSLTGVSDALAHLRCQVLADTGAARNDSPSKPGRPIPPLFRIPTKTQQTETWVYVYEINGQPTSLPNIPKYMLIPKERVNYVLGARDPYNEGFLWILETHTRRGRTVKHLDLVNRNVCQPWADYFSNNWK